MVSKNSISIFISTFLVIGFLFLALPEKGFSEAARSRPVCCQYFVTVPEEGDVCIEVLDEDPCPAIKGGALEDRFEGSVCNEPAGLCMDISRNVPTLSEWGLIAVAGILGIVGFMVIRRRKIST